MSGCCILCKYIFVLQVGNVSDIFESPSAPPSAISKESSHGVEGSSRLELKETLREVQSLGVMMFMVCILWLYLFKVNPTHPTVRYWLVHMLCDSVVCL